MPTLQRLLACKLFGLGPLLLAGLLAMAHALPAACPAPGATLASASLSVACDDAVDVYVNGHLLARTPDNAGSSVVQTYPVPLGWLIPGPGNVIASTLYDYHGGSGGLTYKLLVTYSDGSTAEIVSNPALFTIQDYYDGLNTPGPLSYPPVDGGGNAWTSGAYVQGAGWNAVLTYSPLCFAGWATIPYSGGTVPWIGAVACSGEVQYSTYSFREPFTLCAFQTPTPTLTPTPSFTPGPCASVQRLNAGGAAYTDSLGHAWAADQAYASGGFGYVGTPSTYSVTSWINGTADPTLYQTERQSPSLEYKFTVPNGTYQVTLKFAELYFTGSGQRVFSVYAQGAQVIANLDLVATAGSYTAYDRTFAVSVTAGVLDLTFLATVDQPIVNAIQVMGLSNACSPTVTPTATPTATPTPSPTASPTSTASPTASDTPSRTPTFTATASSTPSATSTATPTATGTPTPSSTPTATPTASPSGTATPTATPTCTATATGTATPTATVSATPTASLSASATPTPSDTPTPSPTPTGSPTVTATLSPSDTPSPTPTSTPSPTVTATLSPSDTPSPTPTSTPSPTVTATLSPSDTPSSTPTSTPSPTASDTPTVSPTATPSITSSASPTGTSSATATPTASPTASPTATPTVTASFTVSPTASPSPTITPTPVPLPFGLDITVYNEAGEVVRHLFQGRAQQLPQQLALSAGLLQAGSGQVLGLGLPGLQVASNGAATRGGPGWDLNNDGGQAVSGGVYYLKAEFRDAYGTLTVLSGSVQVAPAPSASTLRIYNAAGEVVWSRPLDPSLPAITSIQLPHPAVFAPVFGADGSLQSAPLAIQALDVHGATHTLTWDGKSNLGRPVATGSYLVELVYQQPGSPAEAVAAALSVLATPPASALDALVLAPNPAPPGTQPTLWRAVAGPALLVAAYNLAGERIWQSRIPAGTGAARLAPPSLSAGVYLLRVTAEGSDAGSAVRVFKLALVR